MGCGKGAAFTDGVFRPIWSKESIATLTLVNSNRSRNRPINENGTKTRKRKTCSLSAERIKHPATARFQTTDTKHHATIANQPMMRRNQGSWG